MHTVSTIDQYIAAVRQIRDSWFPGEPYSEVWFRGVNNSEHELLPGAYRRPNYDENSLFLSFRALVPTLLPHQPADEWEWYYLAQHYGVPTRLLDWTESPLAALYFALENEAIGKAPCVWALDPLALNALSREDGVLTPTHSGHPVENWLPHRCKRGAPPCSIAVTDDNFLEHNRFPLAIFPTRHNPRIVAQRGTFTVHGVEPTAVNRLGVIRGDGSNGVEKIEIDPAARLTLASDLWMLGISRTAIYPEPQSLAEDLRRLYGAT